MNNALFGDMEDEDLGDAIEELDKDIAKDMEEIFDLPNVPVSVRANSKLESKEGGSEDKEERIAIME